MVVHRKKLSHHRRRAAGLGGCLVKGSPVMTNFLPPQTFGPSLLARTPTQPRVVVGGINKKRLAKKVHNAIIGTAKALDSFGAISGIGGRRKRMVRGAGKKEFVKGAKTAFKDIKILAKAVAPYVIKLAPLALAAIGAGTASGRASGRKIRATAIPRGMGPAMKYPFLQDRPFIQPIVMRSIPRRRGGCKLTTNPVQPSLVVSGGLMGLPVRRRGRGLVGSSLVAPAHGIYTM